MRKLEIPTLPSAEPAIPVELPRLREIVYNLWWCWSPEAHRLFHRIAPHRWLHYRNPVELLLGLEQPRWEQLLNDPAFLDAYQAVSDQFDRYMAGDPAPWFQVAHHDYGGGPFAYFSTEFGWHESVGIYSGGLGILSGDHCKSASDLGIPFVGVGLMYRRGYFQQTIDRDGFQQHFYPDYDLKRLPVRPVAGPDGKELRVSVDFPGRRVQVKAWKAQIGRAPVLLLDSDLVENLPQDRPITSILYVAGREMRLCQEILLGIGGVRVLEALRISPSVWHMNEGHSAFLGLERIHRLVDREKISFEKALERCRGNTVFTTHTPVPAGNETFQDNLIRKYFTDCAERCGTDIERLLALGRADPDRPEQGLNLTALAIRSSGAVNGVSALHGKVADRIWKRLQPEGRENERLIGSITNGVHTPTWIGPELRALLQKELGSDFLMNLLEPEFREAIHRIPDEAFWEVHRTQKKRLIAMTRKRLAEQQARHGRSPDDLKAVESFLDPEHLTLGFARRFATYKRAALLFRDVDRLKKIVGDEDRPVQILFAGKAHPADRPGQELIKEICRTSLSPGFRGRIQFLENYDMRVARFLVQGVDVWLNTPLRPQEASGTSGMKAALNGGLNCSILDGWWCEGYDPSHGWKIGEDQHLDDPDEQDRIDADSLYRVLEEELVPAYYRIDEETGLPMDWIERMKNAVADLAPRFSTHRMVREYTEKYYLPASGREGWGTGIDEVRLWSP